MAERDEIEGVIRAAFAGVRLGSGHSLRQAEAIEDYREGLTVAEFEALPESEVTDDWSLVPEEELRRDNAMHLDPEGLRYYLPALMLWLLDNYDHPDWLSIDGAQMTLYGTIGVIAPSSSDPQARDWTFGKYDAFSAEQKAVVATYVEALPRLVHLREDDAADIASALDFYWRQFLPPSVTPMAEEADLQEDRKHLNDALEAASRDYDQAILTIAAGTLAVSVTFMHDVTPAPVAGTTTILVSAWISLGVSVLCMVCSFLTSQRTIRLMLRQADLTLTEAGRRWATATYVLNAAAGFLLALGLGLLGWYAVANML